MVSKIDWIAAGVATGIGSLPHHNERDALAVIAQALPQWPHWPQLPAKASEQGFVLQYVQPLLNAGLLTVASRKDPVFTRAMPGWEERAAGFYDAYLKFMAGDADQENYFGLAGEAFAGLDAFSRNFAEYFPAACGVKGQISGPLTVGLQLRDEQGRASFYDDNLRDILVKCLTVQAVLEVRRLQELGKPVLVFIDDPSLFFIGTSNYITLTPELCRQALLVIIDELHREGARVGVHACSQMDWSLLFGLPLDMVSFDAYHFFPSLAVQADSLRPFLERGGKLAWGMVPTSDEAWQETPASLAIRFAEQTNELARRGIGETLVRSRIVWTPSCGTGALAPDLAERVYALLADYTIDQGKYGQSDAGAKKPETGDGQ